MTDIFLLKNIDPKVKQGFSFIVLFLSIFFSSVNGMFSIMDYFQAYSGLSASVVVIGWLCLMGYSLLLLIAYFKKKKYFYFAN